MLQSFPYYIEAEQKKALGAGAPVDVIYYSNDAGRWVRIGECIPSTQAMIEEILSDMK